MPKAGPRKEFLNYIQNHPEYYPILQSKIFIQVLKLLARKAKPLQGIQSQFPKIERGDLDLVLNSLITLNLVAEVTAQTRVVYYTTENGRELLKKFKRAREHFKIA